MKKWFLLLLCLTQAVFAKESTIIVAENSTETLRWIHQFIGNANESIELCTYVTGGKIFLDLIHNMEKSMALKPNLKVYLLTSPLLFGKEEYAEIERLEKTFPHFHLQTAPSYFSSCPKYHIKDIHSKCLIVDGKYFVVGGTNLHDFSCTEGFEAITRALNEKTSIPDGVRDMDVIGSSKEIGEELRVLFHKLFALWKSYESTYEFEDNPELFCINEYFPCTQNTMIESFETFPSCNRGVDVRLVEGNPAQQYNDITQEYVRLIRGAQSEIVIGNYHFTPVESIYDSLTEAVARGVKFNLITNGVWEGAPYAAILSALPSRPHYFPLISNSPNSHIFEYHIENILYHKKVMVVDKRHTIVGSYNLNPKSDEADFETVLVIDSPKVAAEVLKVLERDKKLSQEVTLDEAAYWYYDFATHFKAGLLKLINGFI